MWVEDWARNGNLIAKAIIDGCWSMKGIWIRYPGLSIIRASSPWRKDLLRVHYTLDGLTCHLLERDAVWIVQIICKSASVSASILHRILFTIIDLREVTYKQLCFCHHQLPLFAKLYVFE
ncbi:hypothetical protein CAPTEDRAFT_203619 [Capitella teleta]|uniref:Uncharacterized protein n=1 Tax=Capitella teleta TaxID=283909 RepID=R7T799_CAPTE|nr:hypothetical protein CAPTEDRAFT_203619 [Capitella teleta]|eukprot:ELT89470.1 hypothetical protein CAPTEDRAFT_203619 [Capitella teleta]